MQNGCIYQRKKSVRPTKGIGSGLWQTPVSDDSVNRVLEKWNSRGEPKLSAQVLFPTPTATPYGRSCSWPTPNASDATKWSNQSLSERKNKGQQIRLNTAVSPGGGLGGYLNSDWVELLMGWPLGWSNLEPLIYIKKDWYFWPANWEFNTLRIAVDQLHRTKRLQAIGNGQVPLCAAIAWTLLKPD